LEYLNSGPNASILSERDHSDSTRGRFRFKVLRQPPLPLATIAGDVVHNLRCPLDYFIEECVKRNNRSPNTAHQFPICSTPELFAKAVDKGRIDGVLPRSIKAIEGFQPYQVKPEARRRHPLTHLHKLSNRDKHHMLTISALNADFTWRFVTQDGRVLRSDKTTEPIHDGGVLAELPSEFVINGEKAQLQSQLSIRVGFDEPAFAGFDVAGALQGIREFIGMFMLPAFAVLFDPMPDDLRLISHGLVNPSRRPVDLTIAVKPNDTV
jgi:hypothetical protein